MSGPSGEACPRCYFAELWTDPDDGPDPYFCRRYPPSVPEDDGQGGPMPPTVSATTWCGEFKPKPESTP